MAIEAAFVLPVFFLLLFGIFEFSLFLTTYCNAAYAANVGARYASLNSITSASPASTTQITNVVKSNLYLPAGSGPPTILVIYGNRLGGTPGNYVGDEVGVAVIFFSYPITVPFWGTKTYLLQCQAYRFITR